MKVWGALLMAALLLTASQTPASKQEGVRKTSSVEQGGIQFVKGTYEEIKEMARKQDKDIFVDVYTSWCGPCKKMARETFSHGDVGRFYNENFVCVKLDAEKESEHGFFRHYKASGFPSFFWLNEKGDILNTVVGYKTVDEFIRLGQESANSFFAEEYAQLKTRWEKGERTPKLVNEYLLEAMNKFAPDSVSLLLNDYLEGLSDEQLLAKENYHFLKIGQRHYDGSVGCKTILENYSTLKKHETIPDDLFIHLYRNIVRSTSFFRMERPDDAAQLIIELKKSSSDLVPMYVEILALEKELFDRKWNTAIPKIIPLVKKYGQEHSYLHAELFYTLIISQYFKADEQAEELSREVLQVAELAMKNRPCKQNLLFIAAAYEKMGNTRKAYHTLASLPWFGEPMLSNALYRNLGIEFVGKEFRN